MTKKSTSGWHSLLHRWWHEAKPNGMEVVVVGASFFSFIFSSHIQIIVYYYVVIVLLLLPLLLTTTALLPWFVCFSFAWDFLFLHIFFVRSFVLVISIHNILELLCAMRIFVPFICVYECVYYSLFEMNRTSLK